jgi:long-chain acyl-CoA synthetase
MVTLTISELVKLCASRFGDSVAFQMKRDGEYRQWTFAQVAKTVDNLASQLFALGICAGDRVAVLSENRPEWAISYLTIGSMGAVVVPLDSLASPFDHAGLLKDSGSKGFIVSSKHLAELTGKIRELPDLKFVICFDLEREKDGFFSFSELSNKPAGERIELKTRPSDLLSILYTSGTTGVSKGIMLTHENIMSNVIAVAEIFKMIGPGDNFLSVLPIHHTFETTAGLMCPFYMGSRVTYAESLKSYSILTNMRETGVTVMCGVPLLYKIFLEGIFREVQEKGFLVNLIFKALFACSKIFRSLFRRNIGKTLFGMVHKKLGGKIRFWVSGGAAIDPAVIRAFDNMGITILQGYGLTESSPILTCCSLQDNRIGSVGKAISGVKLKIAGPDKRGVGEIVASGPNIMQGYYKNPSATAEVLKEGWLFTGDQGYIDKDGFVFITGRLKDVIITGSGLNVYPEELERELDSIPAALESCVLGRKIKDGLRKGMEEVIAIVIPRDEFFQNIALEKGISVDDSLVFKILKEEINKLNVKLPEHKRVAAFFLRKAEFPKTSTRKIKRFVLRKEMGLI